VSFRVRAGFSLLVCRHAKLIRQQYVSLLHHYSLSLIILHVRTATSVKHSKSKFLAISLLARSWKASLYGQPPLSSTKAYGIHLCSIFHEVKELSFGSFQQSLAAIQTTSLQCFGACCKLLNNNRIGIGTSAPASFSLPLRSIAIGYAIHLSGSGIGSESATRIQYLSIVNEC
jgi:hypothetical protein